jgi:hypothetical protein
MSTLSVMAGFASHRRHNAHALRDHPHVEPAVSLYGKYSTQKKFREMLQMPGESFLQERVVSQAQDTAHGRWHLM